MTPEQIKESLREWLRATTPPGTRLTIRLDGLLELEVCCDGAVPITTYVCSLPPGHDGDCWCRHKNCNFRREN